MANYMIWTLLFKVHISESACTFDLHNFRSSHRIQMDFQPNRIFMKTIHFLCKCSKSCPVWTVSPIVLNLVLLTGLILNTNQLLLSCIFHLYCFVWRIQHESRRLFLLSSGIPGLNCRLKWWSLQIIIFEFQIFCTWGCCRETKSTECCGQTSWRQTDMRVLSAQSLSSDVC